MRHRHREESARPYPSYEVHLVITFANASPCACDLVLLSFSFACVFSFVFQGYSFGIIPGGFQEATLSKLGTDRVWMKNRKGLIKVQYLVRSLDALSPLLYTSYFLEIARLSTYVCFLTRSGVMLTLTANSLPFPSFGSVYLCCRRSALPCHTSLEWKWCAD